MVEFQDAATKFINKIRLERDEKEQGVIMYVASCIHYYLFNFLKIPKKSNIMM